MKNLRKFSKSTKISFGLFAGLVLLIFCGIGAVAYRTASQADEGVSLPVGAVVYDNTYTPVSLSQTGLVDYAGSGQYQLRQGSEIVPIGAHSLSYADSVARIYGGGYSIDADGNVTPVTQDDEIEVNPRGTLVKLADRRYMIVCNEISDSEGVFKTEDYVYIVMDEVGNARILSNNMALRTTQPTTIVAGDIQFDIANEKLIIGEQQIETSKLIGSSNTYD